MEIAYIVFRNIDLKIEESPSTRNLHLRIDFISIDNNTSLTAPFPVVFTPTKHELMKKLGRPHLSLIIEQNTQVKNINIIRSIRAALQQSTL